MSAPDTKIETQKRRHKGPLVGIVVGLLFGAILIAFWSARSADPQGPTQLQDGSGLIEGTEAQTSRVPLGTPPADATGAPASPSGTGTPATSP